MMRRISQTMSLDSFLTEQAKKGHQDSTGVFTVAVEKASWKLAAYRLGNPSHYPIHLAACAVAGRATEFAVHRDQNSRTDTFRFNSAPFTQADLELLSQPLLGEGVPVRIKELGIALNCMAGQARLRFLSFTKKGGLEVVVSGGSVTVNEVESIGDSGQVMLVKYSSDTLPSIDEFLHRCRFAPLDLTIDGKRRRESIELGLFQKKIFGHYQVEGSEPLMARSSHLDPEPFFKFHKRSRSERSLTLALTWPAEASRHGWTFLSNGVAFEARTPPVSFPFLCGAVATTDLKKDISQSDFVKDDAYSQMVKEVERATTDFLCRYCVNPTDMSPNHLELFRQELLSWFGRRELPLEVGHFLGATEPANQDSETLAFLAERASKRDEWGPFLKALESFRLKAGTALTRSLPQEALSWLEREEELRTIAERRDPQLTDLLTILRTLHRPPAKALPAVKSPAGTVRTVVSTFLEKGDEAIILTLFQSSLPEDWTQFFRSAWALASGHPLPVKTGQPVLDVFVLCEDQKFSQAEQLLTDLGKILGPVQLALLKETVWRLYRGQLPKLTWVRWGVRRAAHLAVSHRREYRRNLKILDTLLAPQARRHYFLKSRNTDASYLITLLARVVYLNRRLQEPESAKMLLCLVLLHFSLTIEDGNLTLPEELPAFPSFGRLPPEKQSLEPQK